MAVLDASFLAKIILREPSSEKARRVFRELVAHGEELRVPCIALAELHNVIWKHYLLLRELGREEAEKAAARAERLWRLLRSYSVVEISGEALRLALNTGITFYDALYAGLARRFNEPLYTYDTGLAEKLREAGIQAIVPV